MEFHWSILFVLETVGTIAFASSGAMAAIEQDLDLLGIIVLGVTAAVGGGMIRDIIIGNIPPALFLNPVYVWMALITVLILFMVVRFYPFFLNGTNRNSKFCPHRNNGVRENYEKVMNFFDAVGLGTFTAVGIEAAVNAGYGDYSFLSAFLGVVTGVGGGILRDIMANQTPFILKKHVYACASITGAVCYILIMNKIPSELAMVICSLIVVIIRLLAAKYRWNLPKATRRPIKGDEL
ncbi:trimeric intracellular cation channel family protein [Lachnospiraceae bacterium 62-35]